MALAAVSEGTRAQDTEKDVPDIRQRLLDADLAQLLEEVRTLMKDERPEDCTSNYEEMYNATLQDGLRALLGCAPLSRHANWVDAREYCREIINLPQDNYARASAVWIRSRSDVCSELLERFGKATLEAAESGVQNIISKHYQGDRLAIAHVDKKASYLRYRNEVSLGAGYFPASSPLAYGCWSIGLLPCSLALSAWLPASRAVLTAFIGHVGVCEDYSSFTQVDRAVRLRMIALAAGAACQLGGSYVNALVDATVLQAIGSGSGVSVESAMAWRAVSGCSALWSPFMLSERNLEKGLVAPMIAMGIHDLLDWRSDTAAGNHENGVSAVLGMDLSMPYHTYLEAILHKILVHPRSGAYAAAAVVAMHFTVSRYAAWEYDGQHAARCDECVRLVQAATQESNLAWAPKTPPRKYRDGRQMREWERLWVEKFEDHGIIQEGWSWFQYLIYSGRIWLFDVLAPGVNRVDDEADWS